MVSCRLQVHSAELVGVLLVFHQALRLLRPQHVTVAQACLTGGGGCAPTSKGPEAALRGRRNHSPTDPLALRVMVADDILCTRFYTTRKCANSSIRQRPPAAPPPPAPPPARRAPAPPAGPARAAALPRAPILRKHAGGRQALPDDMAR